MKKNNKLVEFESFEESAALYSALWFYVQHGQDDGIKILCRKMIPVFHQMTHEFDAKREPHGEKVNSSPI